MERTWHPWDRDSEKPIFFISADKGFEDVTLRVVGALKEIGMHTANKGLENATSMVVQALKEIGRQAEKS